MGWRGQVDTTVAEFVPGELLTLATGEGTKPAVRQSYRLADSGDGCELTYRLALDGVPRLIEPAVRAQLHRQIRRMLQRLGRSAPVTGEPRGDIAGRLPPRGRQTSGQHGCEAGDRGRRLRAPAGQRAERTVGDSPRAPEQGAAAAPPGVVKTVQGLAGRVLQPGVDQSLGERAAVRDVVSARRNRERRKDGPCGIRFPDHRYPGTRVTVDEPPPVPGGRQDASRDVFIATAGPAEPQHDAVSAEAAEQAGRGLGGGRLRGLRCVQDR